jgi:hypothetical protein
MSQKIELHAKFAIGLALIIALTFVSQHMTARSSIRNLPYQSLFYGVLTFSDVPSEHLRRLGFEEAIQCVNTTSFSAIGSKYFAKYQEQMTYRNTLNVIYKEPEVLLKFYKYALEHMQKVNLDYLGKYALDDPQNVENSSCRPLPNPWGSLKLNFFPLGYTLAFVLMAFIGWFVFSLKQIGFYQDFAIVGLLSTIACIADMGVAILGDGKQELIKHLFLANVLFDLAAIVFLNGVLIFCFEFVERNLFKLKFCKSSMANNAFYL